MKKEITTTTLTILFTLLVSLSSRAQGRFSGNELSINGFRAPSVGAEFRSNRFSVHGGYYPTAFKAGENTSFIKAGITLWFLAVGRKEIPSSFYASVDYLRGFNRDYKGKNAIGMEAGFRWMVWKGLNLRIGGIVVAAPGEPVKVNPTPGISYSFLLR